MPNGDTVVRSPVCRRTAKRLTTPACLTSGAPPAPRPVKAFSPSTGKLFVNGFTFDVDDAQRALESEQYLAAEPQATPAGDWIPLIDDASYSAYLNNIRNPSMGRLAAKNFGRGVDISQMLAGRGLQFAGAEKFGLRGRIRHVLISTGNWRQSTNSARPRCPRVAPWRLLWKKSSISRSNCWITA